MAGAVQSQRVEALIEEPVLLRCKGTWINVTHTSQDIERIVRSVLKQYGVSSAVRAVSKVNDGWCVTLARRGHLVELKVPDGSAHAARLAVMRALQIEE